MVVCHLCQSVVGGMKLHCHFLYCHPHWWVKIGDLMQFPAQPHPTSTWAESVRLMRNTCGCTETLKFLTKMCLILWLINNQLNKLSPSNQCLHWWIINICRQAKQSVWGFCKTLWTRHVRTRNIFSYSAQLAAQGWLGEQCRSCSCPLMISQRKHKLWIIYSAK